MYNFFSGFASNCTKAGKFSCASSGLCLTKDALNNRYERLNLNCTSSEKGPCQNNPCGENGFCYEGLHNFYDGDKNFYCGCKPGWKGDRCDSESKSNFQIKPMDSRNDFYQISL